MTKRKPILIWPLMALVLASCVTINIYFPAAAAEEAARTIVRDVLGKEVGQDVPEPEGEPQSMSEPGAYALGLAMGVLEVLVPSAHAAGQANIDISSPAINRLRASMAKRQSKLAPFYAKGVLGFDRRGLVSIKDLSQAALRDRARVKKLLANENSDRNALYREIARANGHPEWEQKIRDTFARVWVEEANPGYWYQDTSGRWKRR